jgi:hypothetical protein
VSLLTNPPLSPHGDIRACRIDGMSNNTPSMARKIDGATRFRRRRRDRIVARVEHALALNTGVSPRVRGIDPYDNAVPHDVWSQLHPRR